MNGYLVDTNVISEYARPNPSSRVLIWLDRTDPHKLYASVITFGELRIGIEDLPQRKRRADLELWLQAGLPAWFDANLLPVTRAIAARWGKSNIEAKRRGTPLHTSDGLIAATALEHDLMLVTRNVKDFAGLGVPVFNPWEYQG